MRAAVTPTAVEATAPRVSRVQSVDRAMTLLRAVSGASADGSTAAQLAETCGLNRATAWRLLNTLELHGMVSCDRGTGHWSVGLAVMEIARSAGLDALVRSAHATLARLSRQTGETAALAVPGVGGLTYVDEVAPSAIVAAMWRGRTVPLHATSTGKVLLAFGDPAAVERLDGTALERFTPTTVVDLPELLSQLRQVRSRGFAVCRGEYEISAWGVSAPVLDVSGRPVAVMSIWGPASRVAESRFEALGALAREAALDLLHH
jgi:DNA-binding IclR family transcriptional regulator